MDELALSHYLAVHSFDPARPQVGQMGDFTMASSRFENSHSCYTPNHSLQRICVWSKVNKAKIFTQKRQRNTASQRAVKLVFKMKPSS